LPVYDVITAFILLERDDVTRLCYRNSIFLPSVSRQPAQLQCWKPSATNFTVCRDIAIACQMLRLLFVFVDVRYSRDRWLDICRHQSTRVPEVFINTATRTSNLAYPWQRCLSGLRRRLLLCGAMLLITLAI
jgi:hypothetical protein